MKFIRNLIIVVVIFGLGYYTGQKPDEVKQKLREFSGVVLENTIGVDQQSRLRRQILHANEGIIEGKAFLLDHRTVEASKEFERVLRHLDQASSIDPNSSLGLKIDMVKAKVREAQQRLADGRSLPPHALEDLRQELQSLLP
ncbi:MAG: hypothetical protein AB7P17_04525 [Nitrospirales bacterium]